MRSMVERGVPSQETEDLALDGESIAKSPLHHLRWSPSPSSMGRQVGYRAVLKNKCPPITRIGARPDDQRGDTAAVW